MNGKLTTAELDDLSKEITTYWKTLGRHLGVGEYVLEGITVNNVQYPSPDEKATEMLKIWHNQGDSTYRQLTAALRKVGKRRLAKRFEVSNWCSVSLMKALKVMNCQTYIP